MPRKKIYVKLQHTHKKCSKRLVANAKSCNKWKKEKSTGKTSWKRERERELEKLQVKKVKSGKWRVQSLRKYNCANWKSMCQRGWGCKTLSTQFRHKFAISHLSVGRFALFVWEFLLERTQKSMQGLIGLKCQAAAGTKAHNFNQNNCPLAVKLHQTTSLPFYPFLPLYLHLSLACSTCGLYCKISICIS